MNIQKVEDEKEKIRKTVHGIIGQLEVQREHWKHLPMEEQVRLGIQSLRDKLLEHNIKPECGITSILTRASHNAKDTETKAFFDGMQKQIGTKGVRFE